MVRSPNFEHTIQYNFNIIYFFKSLIWVGLVLVELFHKNQQILIVPDFFSVFECVKEYHMELIHRD